MANIVGIVNKPQFDTNVFRVGTPIHIKQFNCKNNFQLVNTYGIIGLSEPLKLRVWIYERGDEDFDYMDIPIDRVVTGEYVLSLMKEVE